MYAEERKVLYKNWVGFGETIFNPKSLLGCEDPEKTKNSLSSFILLTDGKTFSETFIVYYCAENR